MTKEFKMTPADVINLYEKWEALGIKVWIDGGWGVDALLGGQTRPHGDLDIVVQQKDIPRLRGFLEGQGYKETKLLEAKPWNFVLGGENGQEIDIHVIVLDGQGNGLYGPAEKGAQYPSASLAGAGSIGGHDVRCISAEYMVKFHSGYALRDRDFKDVPALCEKFGLEYPAEYRHLKKT
jgi:lincosamide nucleotidyltransferase A/C/D/E